MLLSRPCYNHHDGNDDNKNIWEMLVNHRVFLYSITAAAGDVCSSNIKTAVIFPVSMLANHKRVL